MKVGLVGCGTIGSIIARAIDEGKIKAVVAALFDTDREKALGLAEKLKKRPPVCSLEELVEKSDLVVEAASAEAMPGIVEKALRGKKDVLPLSVGGFLGNEWLFDLAREQSCRIFLPSGAIAGLDAVRAAAMADIYSVSLVTRKPPQSLANSKFVLERGLDLTGLREPLVLFEGPALEAVRYFPANLNVAAALSLAGVGPTATLVRIIADPSLDRNVHEIEVTGSFGRLVVRTENVPCPENPRTSYLGPLSALATLKRITEAVQIGS